LQPPAPATFPQPALLRSFPAKKYFLGARDLQVDTTTENLSSSNTDSIMDDRELSQRIKALAKALTSEPPTTVVKLLEDLKKDTAPTEEQLRVRLPPV
jgi:hypothetical protein